MPSTWNNYVEPMVGGGAFFFHVAPKKAILADLNPELINFYRILRDDTVVLITKLMCLRASKTLYYDMRNRKPRSKLESAIRFAYLNRLCWNGLHRVNRKGRFNVPIGDRLPKKMWDEEELYRAASLLRNATLLSTDFETTLAKVRKRDFVFVDPPYPRGARDGVGFNRYSENPFTLDDHRRLGRTVDTLNKRGVFLMILLASSSEILREYPASLTQMKLRTKSLISCDTFSRRPVSEMILTNYPPGTEDGHSPALSHQKGF